VRCSYLIENMSGFICPHCGERSDIFKSGGAEKLAEKTGVPLLVQIPFEPLVVIGGDAGKPHLLGYPDSTASQAIHQVAQAVIDFDLNPV